MAKRRRGTKRKHKGGKTQYKRCMSRALTGKHAKTKKAKARNLRAANRRCGKLKAHRRSR
jgi:hypothetical protein